MIFWLTLSTSAYANTIYAPAPSAAYPSPSYGQSNIQPNTYPTPDYFYNQSFTPSAAPFHHPSTSSPPTSEAAFGHCPPGHPLPPSTSSSRQNSVAASSTHTRTSSGSSSTSPLHALLQRMTAIDAARASAYMGAYRTLADALVGPDVILELGCAGLERLGLKAGVAARILMEVRKEAEAEARAAF